MRWILVFSLLLVGCSQKVLPPTEPTSKMIEQADRVILVVDEKPEESYRKVGQFLSDKGFSLASTDAQLLNIQTNFKTYGIAQGQGLTNQFNLRVNASIRDSTIQFYGQAGSEMFGEVEVENRNGFDAWEELVEIAKDYPHEKIYYSRN